MSIQLFLGSTYMCVHSPLFWSYVILITVYVCVFNFDGAMCLREHIL